MGPVLGTDGRIDVCGGGAGYREKGALKRRVERVKALAAGGCSGLAMVQATWGQASLISLVLALATPALRSTCFPCPPSMWPLVYVMADLPGLKRVDLRYWQVQHHRGRPYVSAVADLRFGL